MTDVIELWAQEDEVLQAFLVLLAAGARGRLLFGCMAGIDGIALYEQLSMDCGSQHCQWVCVVDRPDMMRLEQLAILQVQVLQCGFSLGFLNEGIVPVAMYSTRYQFVPPFLGVALVEEV